MTKARIGLTLFLFLGTLLRSYSAQDITVVGSVDRNRIAFGESIAFTIAARGTRSGISASIPQVDGLTFEGPSRQTSVSIVNGQMSQTVSLVYRVTPTRTGEFTIPAVEVSIDEKKYSTAPIKITVEKGAIEEQLSQKLFVRIRFDAKTMYLGQTARLDVFLFAREDVPLKGVSGFQYEAEGLGYKFLQNLKSGTRQINGENFNVHVIEGAVSPTQTGNLTFGPTALKCQLRVARKGWSGGWPFEDFLPFGSEEVREVPVTSDPISIEVLPLPAEGQPADFAGAVGQWNLEVSAKPTEVAVGDPVTLQLKISGEGNIDLVPTPKLDGLENFKTYEPSVKTTKNELNTAGERILEQVVVPKDTDVKQLPAVSFTYFDPVAKQYKTARHDPIPLVVKAGSGGETTIVSGKPRAQPEERLGEGILHIKDDLGPVAASTPFCATPTFWALNAFPVLALGGLAIWKRRSDKLRSDIAYARRSRAAKRARRLLAKANDYDQVQRALQSYLGDRLNIPASGITAADVDEQLTPRGVNGELISELKACFEACDTARFAGTTATVVDASALRSKVQRLIDELEKQNMSQ